MISTLYILAHAFVGWLLCGATMGIGMKTTSLGNALAVHAIAAPVIFALLSWVYYSWFGYTGPLATAAIFTAVVVFLDVVVVALLIERSFEMFRSFVGTWLPFASIFVVTWLVGIATA